MKININYTENTKLDLPTGTFRDGDWFKCQNCGHTVRILVLGNTTTCRECGGRMVRI